MKQPIATTQNTKHKVKAITDSVDNEVGRPNINARQKAFNAISV